MNELLKTLTKLFNGIKTPARPIPAPIVLTGSQTRSGLSAQRITANAIARFGEAGAPTGAMPDGSPNVFEGVVKIIIEELVKEIQINGKVQIAIAPGIQVTSTGANAGGPVVTQGASIEIVGGTGIII